MRRERWRRWWVIPLAYAVAEVLQYWVNMFVLDYIIGRSTPPMSGQGRTMEQVEQITRQVGMVMLVFSVCLMLGMALIFHRTCHRGTLFRSATVTSVYLLAVRAAFNLHIPVPISLLLLWGPQSNLVAELTAAMGLRGETVMGQILALLVSFAFPYLFALFAKPAPVEVQPAPEI